MSGGSFDHLYVKEAAELLSERETIAGMAAALQASGFPDAALETERLLALIDHARREVGVRAERLSGVWKAVEWHVSGDSGIEDVRKAVTRWRNMDAP